LTVCNQLFETTTQLSINAKNPYTFLKIILVLLQLLAHIAVTSHLWCKSKLYLNLVEILTSSKIVVNVWLVSTLSWLSFCVAAGVTIYTFTISFTKTCGEVHFIGPKIFKCLLFGQVDKTDMSFGQQVLIYITYSLDLWREYAIRTVEYSCDGPIFMICIAALYVSNEFQKAIENFNRHDKKESFLRVIEDYEQLKLFFDATNDAAQIVLLPYILGELMYYAVNVKTFMSLDLESVLDIYIFIKYLLIIYLASESFRKVYNSNSAWNNFTLCLL